MKGVEPTSTALIVQDRSKVSLQEMIQSEKNAVGVQSLLL